MSEDCKSKSIAAKITIKKFIYENQHIIVWVVSSMVVRDKERKAGLKMAW